MSKRTTILDAYGDKAVVAHTPHILGTGRVYLDVTESVGTSHESRADLSLTPKRAKRLAKALRKAAKAAAKGA
jgi:hypothetical protein